MRIAGIDIGGTSIKIGVFEDGALLHKTSRKTPFSNPQGAVQRIAKALEGWDIRFAGVGTAGSVEFTGQTVTASNLGWERVPLKAMLESSLRVPVFVDNDAQAALMAEWHEGACQGAQCALYLTLGTGIGGAMIVDGKPYRGKHNLGADFGHMIVRHGGRRCACGRRGCLEAYASSAALRKLAGGKAVRDVIQRAQDGHPETTRALEKYAHMLAVGMSNLIMVFDPEVIVLGGGVSSTGHLLADLCQRELERIFADTTDPLLCSVRIAMQQNDAGIIGAAQMAMQHFHP